VLGLWRERPRRVSRQNALENPVPAIEPATYSRSQNFTISSGFISANASLRTRRCSASAFA
jgi:hypothetical protein